MGSWAIYMLTIFWGRFRTPRGGLVKQYQQGKPEKQLRPCCETQECGRSSSDRVFRKAPCGSLYRWKHNILMFLPCQEWVKTLNYCVIKCWVRGTLYDKVSCHIFYFHADLWYFKNKQTKLSLFSELLFGLRSSSSIPPKVMPVTHESPCTNGLRQGFPNLMSLLPLPSFR